MTPSPRAFLAAPVVIAFAFVLSIGSQASAQTYGVRAGASIDPDQFVIGGHVETKPLADRIHFRPNVEIGLGNDVTLTALNFELAYKFPARQAWAVYAGGGPALNLIHYRGGSRAEGGFNIMLGAEHREGLFGEVKVGAINSPDFKVTVGYTFR